MDEVIKYVYEPDNVFLVSGYSIIPTESYSLVVVAESKQAAFDLSSTLDENTFKPVSITSLDEVNRIAVGLNKFAMGNYDHPKTLIQEKLKSKQNSM